jgi:transcriptional regulator with XRE-family HTH domain
MLDMTQKAPIGERIAQARERAGLNPTELARRVGIAPQAIYMLENGTTKAPTPGNLFKIADALGVDARELATGVPSARQPVARYEIEELFDDETLRFARRFAALSASERRAWMLGLLLNGRAAPDDAVERAYYPPKAKKKP